MKKCLSIVTAMLMFMADGAAQRPGRFVDTFDSAWTAAPNEEWSLDTTGEIIFIRTSGGSATAWSSIVVPGGAHSIGSGRCLLCGKNAAGDGVLELWAFTSPGGLAMVDSRTIPSVDLVGTLYDQAGSFIYVLDSANSCLLRGVWDGVAPLAPVNLGTFATSAQLSYLTSANDYTLDVAPDGNVSLVEFPVVRARMGYLLGISGSTITVSPIDGRGPGYPAYALPGASSEGAATVSVKASTGIAFQVVRSSNGSVIGSGVGQGVTVAVPVATSEPLVLGDRYSAHVPGAGSSASYEFECVRRYGVSETLSDGTSMTPFFYQRGATSGSLLNVQIALETPPQVIDRTYDCYFLVAFRLPTDPVVQIGQNWVLATSTAFQAAGSIPAHMRSGTVALDVPIPSGLGGLVFLLQCCIADGSQWKFSQIYGSAIQ